MDIEVTALPVPPPWSKVEAENPEDVSYVNDITGEVSMEHPLLRLKKRQEEKVPLESSERPPEELAQNREFDESMRTGNSLAILPEASMGEEVKADENDGEYSDFNCKWKECSIGTKDRFYSLTLRFFHDSGRAAITFHGISGKWRYSMLDGPYGPISRYDLFIGAQIKLFGRPMTIKTTSGKVCLWIDEEAKYLENQRLWLQDKISSAGYVPVVRKEPHIQLQHVTRISETTGTKNLRKIHVQVCKLKEQLCDVGLEHFVDMMPSRQRKGHKKK